MSDIDMSELASLSVSLGRASAAVQAEGRKVVFKAAMNIKKDTQSQLSGEAYWSGLAGKVDFDIFGLTADVGFIDQGIGELAGIHEFGSSRRSPHPTLYPAGDREAPRFEKAALDMLGKIADSL